MSYIIKRRFSLYLLETIIKDRKNNKKTGSFTRKLLEDKNYLYSKLKEETEELIEAAEIKDKKEIIWETADVLYFLLVLIASKNISLAEVEKELERRNKEASK